MKTAFTLIELLVVITIIVVLMALLVPALDKAIESAQQAVCMSNQRQVGLLLSQYTRDHKNAYPYGHSVPPELLQPGNNAGTGGWPGIPPQELFLPYTANATKLYRCPSDASPANYNWWLYTSFPSGTKWHDNARPQDSIGSSYTFSEDALHGYPARYDTCLRAQDVVRPDTFGYMADGNVCPNLRWITVDPDDPARPTNVPPRIKWSHLNTVNFLFGDLHVASVPQWSSDIGGIKDRVRTDPGTEAYTTY